MRASALWEKGYEELNRPTSSEKQSQSSHCGLRISGTAPGNRRPPSAELSYCGLGDRPSASSLLRPIAPNKPNFGWRESEGKCFMGKGLRGIEPANELGKTKPIPGGARMGRVLRDGGRDAPPSRLAPLAFPGRCTNKANLPRMGRNGHGSARSERGQICKTNPIPGGQDIPSFHYSTIPVFQSRPFVRNKANLRKGHLSRRRAGLRQNKANFRTDRMGQEPVRLPGPAVGAILRNKANLARDCLRLDVATRSSYDAQPLKSARIVEEQ